jgi:diketogulonate reductase-like aldo/keto reductase
MLTRKFGWTGVDVPVIGQGTWMIEGSRDRERRSVESLRIGLDLGMTHIDTAEMYGNGRAEELVAAAIAARRRDVFLVSKVLPSNASYDGVMRACERTLKRLRTEYLDLYLLHWEGRYPLGETMRAMETLIAQKLIRFTGVSNFDAQQVQQAEATLKNERLACDQVLYHLGDRGVERRLVPYCAQREIAVVAYSPFGHKAFPAIKALERVARRHNATPRQVVLNFLTRDSSVFTIPKAGNPDHVRENAGAADLQLTEEDIAEIDRAFPAPDHDVPLGMI